MLLAVFAGLLVLLFLAAQSPPCCALQLVPRETRPRFRFDHSTFMLPQAELKRTGRTSQLVSRLHSCMEATIET